RVLFFTDGVATRGSALTQAAGFAAEKNVKLMFVGLGNERKEEGKNFDREPALQKPVNVLFVEGQPRYEYRYIKALLERETAGVIKVDGPVIKLRKKPDDAWKPAPNEIKDLIREKPEADQVKPAPEPSKAFRTLLLEAEDDW